MTGKVDEGKNQIPFPSEFDPTIKSKGDEEITIDPTLQPQELKQIRDEIKKSEETVTDVKNASLPDAPEITAPKRELLQNFQATVKDMRNNPWLAQGGSYLASLWRVTNELVNLKRKTHYNEAMVSMKTTQLTLELAKSIAEVTQASYNDQANEKMVEAVSAFVNVAISTIQLGRITQNLGQATTKVEKEIADKKTHASNLEEKTGVGAGDQNPLNLPQRTPAQQKEIDTANEAATFAEQRKGESIRQETQHLDQFAQIGAEIQKQSVQAASSMIVAMLKLDEGRLESLKQLLEGGMQVMRAYLEKSSRASDEEKADISKLLESFNKIAADDTRAHQMGRG